jgi:protein TonB
VARRLLPRLKPAPLAPTPAPAPEVEDAPPSSDEAPDVSGAALPTGVVMDSAAGAVVGGVVGGLMRGVLASGVPPPPSPLTPEEREEWMERYMETLIRGRFMHVRYPHLAAAAGITGQVLLRVSINSRGRLLKLELLGRCPHPVLCDAATQTVRDAAPFPPPPPELGNPFLLELPFRYHLH